MTAGRRPGTLDGWCQGTVVDAGTMALCVSPAPGTVVPSIATWTAFLRYMEEALAEGYAQRRVNGIKGLPVAIRFPTAQEYVTSSAVLKEGAVGSVVVAGVVYWAHVESAPTP